MFPQEKMLNNCLKVIQRNGLDSRQAFNQLLDWLAWRSSLCTSNPLPEISDKLTKVFSKELLQQDPWDWLGEVAQKLSITNPRNGQFFTPRSVSDCMAQMFLHDSINNPTILDPCMGSGRLLLSAYKIKGPKGRYFGADIDLFAYRIALINMWLYGIPALLLRCDSLRHDLTLGHSNWMMANLWDGPSWELLQ